MGTAFRRPVPANLLANERANERASKRSGEGGPASAQARVRQYVALTKQKCNTHSVPRIAKRLLLTL
jgi:hypothetical protein